MGTLTLNELKVEVKAGLGNRTDTDPRLTRFLNLAQQRIARLHDFDEMETISLSTFPFAGTAADKYITLPGLREIYSFKLINGQQSYSLVQVTARMWNRTIPAPQHYTRHEPKKYTIWNNTCVIWPLANRAGIEDEIWWTRWPREFQDALGDEKSEYNQKDEVLIELSLVYAFNSLGKIEDAQAHWARARNLLVEAVQTDQTKPDLEILPGPGNDQLGLGNMPAEYWTDPFLRSAP